MNLLNMRNFIALAGIFAFNIEIYAQNNVIEEVFVTAEKRSESLQDISQAVTAINGEELESKNIESFVDLSAIVPGVTVAKNEGYKTVISIRGVGNETNQNAIAAPSVAFHMDGIFIASPFALQTDFVDVDISYTIWHFLRVEVPSMDMSSHILLTHIGKSRKRNP